MQRKRKNSWILLAILSLCAVPLSVRALDAWNYATSDDIERTKLDTQRILSRFEKTKDASEIETWLLHGPTEANGTQVNLTLGRWALQHQNDFVDIIESLPANRQAQFRDSFCNSLNQSSLVADFTAAFTANRSKVVKVILKNLA